MGVWSKNMFPLRKKKQPSRHVLDLDKHQDTYWTSPNSNPPPLTHPSAFRRAQTEADAWSQHLVNYLALFILPEIKNHMSVSSTFGNNEHIRMAQNAWDPTKIFFSCFPLIFFCLDHLQISVNISLITHTHPVSTRTESVKNACERACPYSIMHAFLSYHYC